jgi:hypothetical protein
MSIIIAKYKPWLAAVTLITIFLFASALTAMAQSTVFTYQGRLTDANLPPDGIYDFEFKLFDALTEGTQELVPIQRLNVQVTGGAFIVLLDFGAGSFPGADRFLEIGVRPAGNGEFTTMTPRQLIPLTPYSIRSSATVYADQAINATYAQDATRLGGVPADQYVKTDDPRLSPLPASALYIQNSTTQQTSSNFNISGNGVAGGTLTGNIVSATTAYNIGISRVLSSPGSFNFFAGNLAGTRNTTGSGNSFFGVNAGVYNTEGSSNAFFGFEAGRNNTTGASNSYVGRDAGRSNTTGSNNAFFGADAGQSNTTGGSNAFFGFGAGQDNTTAAGNSFFGALAGSSNTTGGNNSFFGFETGRLSREGGNNSFFGYEAGESNVSGINNSFFGYLAGKLNTGSRNSFFGSGAGQVSAEAFNNSFFGDGAGGANAAGDNNSFFGYNAGENNTTGDYNTVIGSRADVDTTDLTNATAIGARAYVSASNALVLGQISGVNGATANTNVGVGVSAPLDRLHVDGIIRVDTLGAAGGVNLCRNANHQISTCSSSLRYKTDLSPFRDGLNLVNRLNPISFTWKDGGMRDLGLGAEDVAAIEPLLVVRNDKGEVEGVKYDRITLILLNAVKEQQELINKQQQQLDALRKLVCKSNRQAEACK